MNQLTKWVEESGKEITLSQTKGNFIVDFCGISSKITQPTNTFGYYMVSSNDGKDYIWYTSINRYCIEKEAGAKNVLAKLVRFIEKEISNQKNTDTTEKKNETDNRTQSSGHHDSPKQTQSLEDLQFEYYMMKSTIAKIIESGKCSSDLTSEGNVRKLYDEKTVANIIGTEFLECWKIGKETNSMEISLVNENIFCWKVQLKKFNNKKLLQEIDTMRTKFEIDYIEFEISFHERFYPNYPPLVKIIKPNLKDSLGHRISNSKMTQLAYWTPTRSTLFIINRVHNILEKYAQIEVSEVKKKNSIHVSNMIGFLTKFSSLIDLVKEDDELDKDIEFTKFNIIKERSNDLKKQKTNTTMHKKPNTGAKSGTGYEGYAQWNIEEYTKLQKEKDRQISSLITKIVVELQSIDNTSDDFSEVCRIISSSLLLQYLKQQFKQCTLLEMQNREQFFKLLTNLLEVLATEKSIYLYDIQFDKESLYDTLKSISTVIKGATKMDNENEFLQMLNGTLEIIIFPMFDDYLSKKEKNDEKQVIIKKEIIENTEKSINTIYKEKLSPLRFEYSTEILNSNYKKEYKDIYKASTGQNWRSCQKRLSIELPSLMPEGQLPIDFEASVFLRIDEDNPMIIRSLMTGPHDTPYESGCFIFDLFPTHEYPKNFTNCWYMNTGGRRFNPNLYESGKVCLSILGTWGNKSAGDSENWNEKTSSLLQVLISIQAQILIPEPYFNEPSHEIHIGRPEGISASQRYNNDIRYFTMCHAIRDFLANPKLYPQFEKVVLEHFKLKKERILKTCKKWSDDAIVSDYANPTKMLNVYNEISGLLKTY